MKYTELAALSDDDRAKKLHEAKKELIKLNGQVATGTSPKNPGRISQLKKMVARILTFEHQKSSDKK